MHKPGDSLACLAGAWVEITGAGKGIGKHMSCGFQYFCQTDRQILTLPSIWQRAFNMMFSGSIPAVAWISALLSMFNYIPLYEHTVFYLSIHQLIAIWGVYVSWVYK